MDIPPTLPVVEADPVDDRRRRANTAALVVIAAILALGAFTYLGYVFQPVLVAVFLFFIMKPAADWFARRGLSAWLAWLVLFGLLVALGILLTQIVYSQAVEFNTQREEYGAKLMATASRWTGTPEADLRHVAYTELFEGSTRQIVGYTFGIAASFAELSLMVVFYLLFVILDARDVPGRIRRAFDPDTSEHLIHVGRSIIEGITEYMQVKTLVSLGMAGCAGAAMWAFDLSYWQLWAFLVFLLNYVTYIGSLVVLVPPIVLALVELDPVSATVLAVLLSVNRLVWIDYVEIHHSGRQLNINSVLILMSLAYWGWFWGVLGLILAVPMLTSAKIVLSNFETTKRFAVLMSED